MSNVTCYATYPGYNLRLVSDLHKALKTLYGWTQSSSGTWCGSSGQVLIYNGQLPFSASLILTPCVRMMHLNCVVLTHTCTNVKPNFVSCLTNYSLTHFYPHLH